MFSIDANTAWLETLEMVYNYGEPVEIICADGPTRMTKETMGMKTVIDMAHPVISYAKRKLNYRFMAGEAAWILSGSDQLEDIMPFNKHIAKFSDDGVRFEGAYGPKIVGQMDYVIRTLIMEKTSRRALLTIWRENPPPSRDTPCTISTQFLVREDRLYLIVTMRSSDIWLGLPYDLFTFSMLGGYVLLKLRDFGLNLRGLGTLTNFAGSRHLYQHDLDKIKERDLINDPGAISQSQNLVFNPYNFKSPQDLIEHLWAVARGERESMRDTFISDLIIKN